MPAQGTYDYVIVGAGSAGCALASRLSADPQVRVALLEAGGPPRNPFFRIPKAAGKILVDPRYVWNFPARPDAGAAARENWLRGKVMGGTSAVNGLIYVGGSAADFDLWESLGCTGWGSQALAASFAAVDSLHGSLQIAAADDELCAAFLQVLAQQGVPRRRFLDDSTQAGAGPYRWSIARGRRVSAADAFLADARQRRNLHIVTHAHAEHIIFEGDRAAGIAFRRHGDVHSIAAREVLLAAGAIQSPKLLLLAGIGPAEELRKHGIALRAESPEVGANLREHRSLHMQFRVNSAASLNAALRGPRLWHQALRYALARRGVLASGFWEAGAFLRVADGEGPPDAQLILGRFAGDIETKRPARYHGMQCIAYLLRPESRGRVTLAARDPALAPEICANYLADAQDRALCLRLFHRLRAIFASPPLAALIEQEIRPGAALDKDADPLAAFGELGVPNQHATGTCRMGADARAVIDPQLRVRGVRGLRVMDASVMPTMISANPSRTVMAMAWHAAGIIAATRGG